MNEFKLLGIQTKDRIKETNVTDTDYLKVLKENTYYSFYSSYQFNKETKRFTYHPKKDVDLYSLNRKDQNGKANPLHINISAIVGENGAGKSTLIELLFLAIHNIAATCKILKDPDNANTNLPIESGVKLDIFYSIDKRIYCISLNDLDVTFSYQIIREDNSYSNFSTPSIATKKHLQYFLYSIAINYSLYGLNSNHIGEWVRALFHKNDGYQTPLVINPMRDKGQIDINREEYLAKSRLISNLLIKTTSNNHLKLTNKQVATAITFTLNTDKIQNIYDHKWAKPPYKYTFKKLYSDYNNETTLFTILYSELIGLSREKVDVIFKKEVEKYIVKKLFKIARTYDQYKVFLTDNSDDNEVQPSFYEKGNYSLEKYITLLKKDSSHITFKLNQAVNYIKNNPLVEDEIYKWNKENKHFHIPIKKLAKRINTSKLSEIINLIPPSLFNIEIHLEEIEHPKNKSVFSGLSSGEQQLIHSVQSILYHIINVNSVFGNNISDDVNYSYINLMLDEIELYFHPAHQKEFIQYILNGIKSLDIPKIKGINMLFSTHSPFILSDIPSNNILKLKKGEPSISEQKTFGANIHDLLADSFFMSSTIGEFSKEKINEFIKKLNDTIKNRNDKKPQLLKSSISELEELGGESFINLIGESLVKDKLLQMYFLATEKNDKESLKKYYQRKLENLN